MSDCNRDETAPIDTAGGPNNEHHCAANDNTLQTRNGADGRNDVQGEADLPLGGPAPSDGQSTENEQPETDNEEPEVDDEPEYTLPADLYPVFYPLWALADTPHAKAYCALYDDVVLTIQPQDVFDEMDAVEITDGFWRSRQIANSVDTIITAARRDALATILMPMARHEFQVATAWAEQYFSGDPNKRKPIEDLLRVHGMGPEAIEAQALMQRTPVLDALSRITTRLGIHRHEILAAQAKRREARQAKHRKRQRVAA
jgi:hypothetical protein